MIKFIGEIKMKNFCKKTCLLIIILFSFMLTGCEKRLYEINEVLSDYVYDEVIEQINNNPIVNDFSVNNIEFDLVNDTKEYCRIKCRVKLESSKLCDYADTKYDDKDRINRLRTLFKHIKKVYDNIPKEKLSFTVGKKLYDYTFYFHTNSSAIIENSTFLISDTNGNIYKGIIDPEEYLYINYDPIYIKTFDYLILLNRENANKEKNEKAPTKGLSSTNKGAYHNSNDSYDEGYDDIYLDEYYDLDRYYSDPEYALGVDDAMDDEEW